MGPNAPKWNGQIEHLIRYLLTVYKRIGNTAITADLQWGASALHKRDEQKERIEQLERALAAAVAQAQAHRRILATLPSTVRSSTWQNQKIRESAAVFLVIAIDELVRFETAAAGIKEKT